MSWETVLEMRDAVRDGEPVKELRLRGCDDTIVRVPVGSTYELLVAVTEGAELPGTVCLAGPHRQERA